MNSNDQKMVKKQTDFQVKLNSGSVSVSGSANQSRQNSNSNKHLKPKSSHVVNAVTVQNKNNPFYPKQAQP